MKRVILSTILLALALLSQNACNKDEAKSDPAGEAKTTEQKQEEAKAFFQEQQKQAALVDNYIVDMQKNFSNPKSAIYQNAEAHYKSLAEKAKNEPQKFAHYLAALNRFRKSQGLSATSAPALRLAEVAPPVVEVKPVESVDINTVGTEIGACLAARMAPVGADAPADDKPAWDGTGPCPDDCVCDSAMAFATAVATARAEASAWARAWATADCGNGNFAWGEGWAWAHDVDFDIDVDVDIQFAFAMACIEDKGGECKEGDPAGPCDGVPAVEDPFKDIIDENPECFASTADGDAACKLIPVEETTEGEPATSTTTTTINSAPNVTTTTTGGTDVLTP